jgi:hypothetical protein
LILRHKSALHVAHDEQRLTFIKEESMITKKPGAKQGRVLVAFELPSNTWAERVNLW